MYPVKRRRNLVLEDIWRCANCEDMSLKHQKQFIYEGNNGHDYLTDVLDSIPKVPLTTDDKTIQFTSPKSHNIVDDDEDVHNISQNVEDDKTIRFTSYEVYGITHTSELVCENKLIQITVEFGPVVKSIEVKPHNNLTDFSKFGFKTEFEVVNSTTIEMVTASETLHSDIQFDDASLIALFAAIVAVLIVYCNDRYQSRIRKLKHKQLLASQMTRASNSHPTSPNSLLPAPVNDHSEEEGDDPEYEQAMRRMIARRSHTPFEEDCELTESEESAYSSDADAGYRTGRHPSAVEEEGPRVLLSDTSLVDDPEYYFSSDSPPSGVSRPSSLRSDPSEKARLLFGGQPMARLGHLAVNCPVPKTRPLTVPVPIVRQSSGDSFDIYGSDDNGCSPVRQRCWSASVEGFFEGEGQGQGERDESSGGEQQQQQQQLSERRSSSPTMTLQVAMSPLIAPRSTHMSATQVLSERRRHLSSQGSGGLEPFAHLMAQDVDLFDELRMYEMRCSRQDSEGVDEEEEGEEDSSTAGYGHRNSEEDRLAQQLVYTLNSLSGDGAATRSMLDHRVLLDRERGVDRSRSETTTPHLEWRSEAELNGSILSDIVCPVDDCGNECRFEVAPICDPLSSQLDPTATHPLSAWLDRELIPLRPAGIEGAVPSLWGDSPSTPSRRPLTSEALDCRVRERIEANSQPSSPTRRGTLFALTSFDKDSSSSEEEGDEQVDSTISRLAWRSPSGDVHHGIVVEDGSTTASTRSASPQDSSFITLSSLSSRNNQRSMLQQRVSRLLLAARRLEESELDAQYRAEQSREEQAEEQDVYDAETNVEDLLCAATLDCLSALRADCEKLAGCLLVESGSENYSDVESCGCHHLMGSPDGETLPLVDSVQAMELELQTLLELARGLCSNAQRPFVATHRPSPVKRSLEMELMAAASESASRSLEGLQTEDGRGSSTRASADLLTQSHLTSPSPPKSPPSSSSTAVSNEEVEEVVIAGQWNTVYSPGRPKDRNSDR